MLYASMEGKAGESLRLWLDKWIIFLAQRKYTYIKYHIFLRGYDNLEVSLCTKDEIYASAFQTASLRNLINLLPI